MTINAVSSQVRAVWYTSPNGAESCELDLIHVFRTVHGRGPDAFGLYVHHYGQGWECLGDRETVEECIAWQVDVQAEIVAELSAIKAGA